MRERSIKTMLSAHHWLKQQERRHRCYVHNVTQGWRQKLRIDIVSLEIKIIVATLRISGRINIGNLLAMKHSNTSMINAFAVASLSIAVIVLAIKKPRCDCKNDLQQEEASSVQQPLSPRPTRSRGQRELRKFWIRSEPNMHYKYDCLNIFDQPISQ